MFLIFVVAYLFYLGKSLGGPTPQQVLKVPIIGTVCLLSSSATIAIAVRALRRGRMGAFTTAWAVTIGLGVVFFAASRPSGIAKTAAISVPRKAIASVSTIALR